MIKKIKQSLMAKTFITIASLLSMCCIIIYIFIYVSLPSTYYSTLENSLNAELADLVTHLEMHSIKDSSNKLMKFSSTNNANLSIEDENENVVYSINSANQNTLEDDTPVTYSHKYYYDNTEYYIEVQVSFETVNQVRGVIVKNIPAVTIIIIILSLLGAYVYSRYFTRPLIQISKISKKISNLDLTWKCETNREDEIGVLAKSLNYMGEKLSQTIEKLKNANVQLENEISKSKLLEQQRYDLFLAVSHELKTPITIMKGEVEGMIQKVGDYENRDKYLRHIYQVNIQLEKLVQEILSITKLESNQLRLNKSEVSMFEFITLVIQPLYALAEDKQIDFSINIENDFYFEGDLVLLQKAFRNIVHNAIKYSPENAEIIISINTDYISIKNTNVNIASDDLKYLFIPFYKSDKSRNSKTGGSGLGLYITKTIFEKHNFKYTVQNDGNDVIFQIYLPQY